MPAIKDPEACAMEIFGRWVDLQAEIARENRTNPRRLLGLQRRERETAVPIARLLPALEELVEESYGRMPPEQRGDLKAWQQKARRALLDEFYRLSLKTKDASLRQELAELDPAYAPPPALSSEQLEALRRIQAEVEKAEETLAAALRATLLAMQDAVRQEGKVIAGSSAATTPRLRERCIAAACAAQAALSQYLAAMQGRYADWDAPLKTIGQGRGW